MHNEHKIWAILSVLKKSSFGDSRRIRPSNLTAGAQKNLRLQTTDGFPQRSKKEKQVVKSHPSRKSQTKREFSLAIYWKATGVLFT